MLDWHMLDDFRCPVTNEMARVVASALVNADNEDLLPDIEKVHLNHIVETSGQSTFHIRLPALKSITATFWAQPRDHKAEQFPLEWSVTSQGL